MRAQTRTDDVRRGQSSHEWLLRGVGDRLGLPVDAAARGLRGWAGLVYRAAWTG